ncbi:DnaJ (Hsp40), sub B, member 12 [Homalodisca vitripennis]|nr:DnaJ (Hsp40), sub B, member 12 [Homalodisca vitripennis]
MHINPSGKRWLAERICEAADIGSHQPVNISGLSTTKARNGLPPAGTANGYTIFLQMLPIMLVVILSMMSSLFISDPVYSLTASPKFPVIRNTMNLRVPYYVKETFHNEYQGSLRRLEASVEEEYVTNLRHACYREKNYIQTIATREQHLSALVDKAVRADLCRLGCSGYVVAVPIHALRAGEG